MPQTYNPADWYWLADDGRLFSSARAALVTKDDAAYVAWCATGTVATRWPRNESGAQTDQALQDVLAPHGLAVSMQGRREIAFTTAMAYGNSITARVINAYSDVEARTWPLQRAQADTVLGGGTLPPDALLLKLAERRGMEIEAFALLVQTKAQAFETIADVGQELRFGAEGLLSPDLDSPEKLAAAVAALRDQALRAASALGLNG